VGEPAHRPQVARPRAVSHPVPRGSPTGDAGVLRAFLPPSADRGAARRPPRRARPRCPLSATPQTAPIAGQGRRREVVGRLVATGLLLAFVLAAFSVGRYPVSPMQLWTVLWSRLSGAAHPLPVVETVVFRVRGPRVLSAAAIGATLAAAGAAYQSLFRN